MDKSQIADILEEIALLQGILEENEFRIRAYSSAARTILTTGEDIFALAKEKKLTAIKGIGKGIAETIQTIIATGASPELDELKVKVPPGVVEMLKVPGLGPKKVRLLWSELNIKSIGELEYACGENRLAGLKGFGEKTQAKILEGVKSLKKYSNKFLLPDAMEAAQSMLGHLAGEPALVRAALAGSIRRGQEVIKDVDLVAGSHDPEKVIERFVTGPDVASVVAKGMTKAAVRSRFGLHVDLRVVPDEKFPYTLHHSTGSREHNTALRARANSMGIKMNEYGLFKDGELIPCKDEMEIFKALGLGYIPPERRENVGEIREAEGVDELKLLGMKDIKGIFHLHTTYSDGVESLETMARECMKRGWEYMGVADHSQTAFYAGGLKPDGLKRQSEEIDRLNEKLEGFTIFKGVESDILEDGRLDYPEDILKSLDFVIASIHSRYGASEDEKRMTERLTNAIRNPYTTMLGHMTGRLLLARDAYALDTGKIIEECAKNKVVIELNSNPQRLDITWRRLEEVLKSGNVISINPDAHRIPGLDHVRYGVTMARKGGLKPEHVYNSMDASRVAADLAARREGRLKG